MSEPELPKLSGIVPLKLFLEKLTEMRKPPPTCGKFPVKLFELKIDQEITKSFISDNFFQNSCIKGEDQVSSFPQNYGKQPQILR